MSSGSEYDAKPYPLPLFVLSRTILALTNEGHLAKASWKSVSLNAGSRSPTNNLHAGSPGQRCIPSIAARCQSWALT